MDPYLLVLHDDRAQISCIKTENYSVFSRKLITRFPIIFISVKTKLTLQIFIHEKVVRLWPHLSHRLLRPCVGLHQIVMNLAYSCLVQCFNI